MTVEQMHSQEVKYGPEEDNRSMLCVSVKDFEGYEPLDLRSILPETEAPQALKRCSINVAKHVLAERQRVIGESRPLQNMANIAAFIGELSIRPFGKLSYVDELEPPDSLEIRKQPIVSPGITSNIHRQSFVIGKNMDIHETLTTSPLIPSITREEYAEHIAVHELVHLAGIPDIAYYKLEILDQNRRSIGVEFSPSIFHKVDERKKGSFFEEGFATLCGLMYLWGKYPEVLRDTRVEEKRSPNGTVIYLPARHLFTGNSYAYAAWAMERLIDFEPKIFDVFLQSRKYGADSENVRRQLKCHIDKIDSRLFESLDVANPHNLEFAMLLADITDEDIKHTLGRTKYK
jgi:hypothetical protein